MIKKSKQKPKTKYLIIAFLIMFISILYATIASAALNANLQITGEALFVAKPATKEFFYQGSCEEYVVPQSGIYKLETWGASGGNPSSGMSGKGGYSTGTITLYEGTKIYGCVGGEGKNGSVASGKQILEGGFNGGGNAWGQSDGNNGSGGGATDFRINSNSLYARVIVAGGGGGAVSAGAGPQIGHGGGSNAMAGITNFGGGCTAAGGTSTTAGTGCISGSGETGALAAFTGAFGTGADGRQIGITGLRSGGGGGWYGGGSSFVVAGGGSGFVYTSATASSVPTGYILSSMYYLTNAENINGNNTMPTHSGEGTMSGNQGNGFAKLSFISYVSDKIEFYLNGSADMQIAKGSTYTEQNVTLIINGVNLSSSIARSGSVNTSVRGTYAINYSYTYNGQSLKLTRRVFVEDSNKSYTANFSYTGGSQTATAPYTGWYKLEVWGGKGGNAAAGSNSSGYGGAANGTGGAGGDSIGYMYINEGTSFNIYVGGAGANGSEDTAVAGGYNGGGKSGKTTCTFYNRTTYGGGGGGATDIRIGGTALNNRVIVAGGGGGASGRTDSHGGTGGGLSGANGVVGGNGSGSFGYGGTQTAAGSGGGGGIPGGGGSFGNGGSGYSSSSGGARSGGGGGGGWFGGGAGANSSSTISCSDNGGGGSGGAGSGFVWNTGANVSAVPSGYSVSNNYQMTGINTTNNTAGGSPGGSNGYARITFVVA